MTGGPTKEAFLPEVMRALELFKTGSLELRLALAQSMNLGYDVNVQFWKLCGDNDFESRHYLIGIVLPVASAEEKRELTHWLLSDAHPSYAAALLSNLTSVVGSTEEEMNSAIPFLKELYRQPGAVIVHQMDGRKPRSIQSAVIRLLPNTLLGRNLLIQWMSCDSKKVDAATLDTMWVKCEEFEIETPGFLAPGLEQRDMVES